MATPPCPSPSENFSTSLIWDFRNLNQSPINVKHRFLVSYVVTKFFYGGPRKKIKKSSQISRLQWAFFRCRGTENRFKKPLIFRKRGLFISSLWGQMVVIMKQMKIQTTFFSKKVGFWGALKFVTSWPKKFM